MTVLYASKEKCKVGGSPVVGERDCHRKLFEEVVPELRGIRRN